MHQELSKEALDQLFTEAHSQNGWLDKDVSDDQLKRLYELSKFGPTSANTNPLRIVFVRSEEAKAKLKPALSAGNVEKTMQAKVTAILARDTAFYTHHGRLMPHMDLSKMYEGNKALADSTATTGAWLQAGYFILAARSIGLDCGPMGGFDNAKVNAAFFEGTTYESIVICSLGYGDAAKVYPRSPRFNFDEICKIA